MKRFAFIVLTAAIILLMTMPAVAEQEAASSYESYELENELTVVLRESHDTDIVLVGLAVKAGQNVETTPDMFGLNYLNTVMMYNGTSRRPTYSAIMTPIQENGGSIGFEPWSSMSFIWAKVAGANFHTAIDTVSDAARNPVYQPEVVSYLVNVIGKDLEKEKLEGRDLAYAKLLEGVFGDHPFGHDERGTAKSVKSLSWAAFRKFHSTYFLPGNSILFVAGNFAAEEAKGYVKECFGDWKSGPEPPVPETKPLPTGRVTSLEASDGDQAHVYFGFRVPGIAHKDGPALAVLSAIWGNGLGSRIFQELRSKEGLAYECYSSYAWENFSEPSMLYAYLGTAPEKVNQVRDGLLRQASDFANRPVSEDELIRGKAIVVNSFYRAMQENTTLVRYMAFFEVAGLGYDGLEKLTRDIRALTIEDIQRVAKKYMRDPILSVAKP